jgi:hypothetical protein
MVVFHVGIESSYETLNSKVLLSMKLATTRMFVHPALSRNNPTDTRDLTNLDNVIKLDKKARSRNMVFIATDSSTIDVAGAWSGWRVTAAVCSVGSEQLLLVSTGCGPA